MKRFEAIIWCVMLGFGVVELPAASPQIIEVHKDLGKSDKERLDDMKFFFKPFLSRYKKDCVKDTVYWVVSKSVYPTEKDAKRHIPKKYNESAKKANSNFGLYFTSSRYVPEELKKFYENKFILTGGLENCSKSDSIKLSRAFGKEYFAYESDFTSCDVSDSFEVVDSNFLPNKYRARRLAEKLHAVMPRYNDESFEFSSAGGPIVVLGACMDQQRYLKMENVVDSNFNVFRIVK